MYGQQEIATNLTLDQLLSSTPGCFVLDGCNLATPVSEYHQVATWRTRPEVRYTLYAIHTETCETEYLAYRSDEAGRGGPLSLRLATDYPDWRDRKYQTYQDVLAQGETAALAAWQAGMTQATDFELTPTPPPPSHRALITAIIEYERSCGHLIQLLHGAGRYVFANVHCKITNPDPRSEQVSGWAELPVALVTQRGRLAYADNRTIRQIVRETKRFGLQLPAIIYALPPPQCEYTWMAGRYDIIPVQIAGNTDLYMISEGGGWHIPLPTKQQAKGIYQHLRRIAAAQDYDRERIRDWRLDI